MNNISLVLGDITTAKVDAIVNAANSLMLGGGGVDGAIHRAAGPKLLEECYKVPEVNGIRCPTGEARITKAGNLEAKYVIHAVGPIYRSDSAPTKHLASAYRSSLQLAQANSCHSIAFPAISCGVYGYPVEEAAHIALSVCSGTEFRSLQISIFLYGRQMLAIWEKALRELNRTY